VYAVSTADLPAADPPPDDAVGHDPVMVREIVAALFPSDGTPRVAVDSTIGRGGHALELARRLPPAGQGGLLVGLDRDPRNLAFAKRRIDAAGVACDVRLFEANFADLASVLAEAGVGGVDAVLADLGVSTNQLFDAAYGLSFQQDAPLDMRLSPDDPLTAAEVVNRWSEERIADLLYDLADEHFSRRIARKIAAERAVAPIQTTRRLADVVRSAVPGPRRRSTESIDPATRTFLALRMRVNAEAENLATLLDAAPRLLRPGGRLAVVSFQSTEDRIVKHALRAQARLGLLDVLTDKPLVPADDEVAANPRSRSSKLRVARRR